MSLTPACRPQTGLSGPNSRRRRFPTGLPVALLILLSPGLLFAVPTSDSNPGKPVVQEIEVIVAVVNEDVITKTELDRRMRLIKQQLQKKGTPLPPDNILRKQLIDQMVMEKLQMQQAEKLGIRIDDETINKVVSNIASENKMTLEQFSAVLAREGYEFSDFRNNIKQEMILSQLHKQRVASRVKVTEREIDNYLATMATRKSKNTEYHLAQILIALPEAASPEQIQAAREKAEAILARLRNGADFAQTAIEVSNGQHALEGGDLGWLKAGQLPTIYSNLITEMKPGEISNVVRSSSGFHIVKLLKTRGDANKHVVHQTQARHILIKPTEILSSNDARAKISALRQRIIDGANFAIIAETNSDDPGSAAEGGNLGWVNPGTMVPVFEAQMDKLAPGEISQPFKTRFGWHIVQVMSRRDYDDTGELKRKQARQEIGQRKTNDALENWLRELRSEAYVEYRLDQ
jgi:peptidyl-prolyl cis-trans isomerase SurA